MGGTEKSDASSASLCQVCKNNDFKYTCPACSMRTCSLECVNAHKAKTNCTGKRPLVEHVAINQFDEKVLRRDISLLEDASCKAHTAQTHSLETRNDNVNRNTRSKQRHAARYTLRDHLSKRSPWTTLHLVPDLFQLAKRNSSCLKYPGGKPIKSKHHQQTVEANPNEANAEPTAPEEASAAPVATTSTNDCAEGTAETSNQAVKEPAPAQEPVVQWKIEWRFQAAKEGTDEVVLNEVSSEETKLGDLLEALVTNKWRRDLSNTIPEYIAAGPGKVSVFMKVLMSHKPHTYHDESPYNNTEQDLSRCNKFWPVDVNKSIKENLYYRVVVEHPVFIVTLEPAKFPVLVEEEQPILEVQKEEAPAPEPSKPEISLAEDLPPPAPSSGKGGWQQHSSRKGGKGYSGKGQWTGQYKGGGREWQNNGGNDGWWNAGKGGGKGSESWYWGPQYPPQPNEWQGGNWNAGWNASGDSWGPGGKGSSKGGDWGQGKGAYYNSSKGGW